MIVHQIFAQISDEEIKNVIVCDNYELANYLARATYGEQAFAVDCLQYPCTIGDHYIEGRFFRDLSDENGNVTGEQQEILAVPTAEQQIQVMEQELLHAQLALTELYETMEV